MFKYTISIVLSILCISSLAQNIDPVPVVGNKGFKAFIKKYIDYPIYDLQQKNEGDVIIEFNTDRIGNVTNSKIIQSVSLGVDSAAISLFKLLLWDPATEGGKAVKGTSEFEIKYNIKGYKKNAKRRGYMHIEKIYSPVDTSGLIYGLKQIDAPPFPILENNFKSLTNYIYSNLTYPEAATKLGLEGDVELMFIIETNGLTSNMVAIKHLGGGCTEEAMRIIESLNWHPGLIDSTAVRTKYNINIKFKKGENKDGYIPNQQGSGI